MTSRVQRTTKIFREKGYRYNIDEKWNQYAKKRQDGFGIIDISVLDRKGLGMLGIQVCGSDYQEHVRKITVENKGAAIDYLMSGNRIQIWAWRKLKKKRGGKAKVWKPRISDIFLVAGELIVEERK